MPDKFPAKLYIEVLKDGCDDEDYFVAHAFVDTIADDVQDVAVYKLVDVHQLKVTKELI